MTDQRAMFSSKGYKGYLRVCLMVFCSPEASNVLWCGDGVHKRECIPSDLYNGVQAIVKEQSKQEKVHDGIEKYIDAVLDAVCDHLYFQNSISDWKVCISRHCTTLTTQLQICR